MRGCFVEVGMRGYMAENRHMVFIWRMSDERLYDVLLEWMLEKTCDVWKEYKYNPIESRQGSCTGSPCNSCIGSPCFLH